MRSIFFFVLMGGITTAVHVAVGLLAHHLFDLPAFTANLVAFSAGFFVSYFGHRTFTFRSRARVSRSMPRFFVVSATSLVINQVIVFSAVNIAQQSYWISLVIMIAVVPVFTYVLSRIWAFDDGAP